MLPCKKIFIDSRTKTSDSVSSSNFKIDLGTTLDIPENTIFYITDVCIGHSWKTISENNDKLYVQATTNSTNPATKANECQIVQLTHGNYNTSTLSAEIKTKLDAAFTSNTFTSPVFTCTPDIINNNITISPVHANMHFKVLTQADLKTGLSDVVINLSGGAWSGGWVGASYDANNTQDINDILGNNDGRGSFHSQGSLYVSGSIDLHSTKNVYLSSSNLGNFSTLGCNGERNIIRKIAVTANQNEVIYDASSSSSDYLDCSRCTLRTLQFALKDFAGNYINLNGGSISFSIVFDKYGIDTQ